MNNKKSVMVNVDRISPAVFNPPRRSSTGSIKQLKDSIAEVGLIYPLIVDEEYNLIDGHRRLACVKSLNWKQVPVFVEKHDARRLYDDVNRTSMKMSSKDDLYVYLSGGPISKKAKSTIEELEKYLDRKDLEYAAENRKSGKGILFSLNLIKNYISNNGKVKRKIEITFLKKAAKYILYNDQSFAVRVALANKIDTSLLIKSIENNAPL